MVTKVWQAEAVRNHLLAVRTGLHAGVPSSLVQGNNNCLGIYFEGCEVTFKYLAERFGISLDNSHLSEDGPASDPGIRTWSRQEIKAILEEAWEVMHEGQFLLPEQTARSTIYYQGIEKTISSLARSFGIRELTPTER